MLSGKPAVQEQLQSWSKDASAVGHVCSIRDNFGGIAAYEAWKPDSNNDLVFLAAVLESRRAARRIVAGRSSGTPTRALVSREGRSFGSPSKGCCPAQPTTVSGFDTVQKWRTYRSWPADGQGR